MTELRTGALLVLTKALLELLLDTREGHGIDSVRPPICYHPASENELQVGVWPCSVGVLARKGGALDVLALCMPLHLRLAF